MALWLLSCLFIIAVVLKKSDGTTDHQVTYQSASTVSQWSKKLLSVQSDSSPIACAKRCTAAGCVHYSYDRLSKTCSLFSSDRAQNSADETSMVWSKEKCSSDGKTWTSTMDSDWQIIVRRLDGSVDFNRSWTEYRAGFGDPCGEFWLGLDALHTLTASGPYTLRVEMTAWNGSEYFSEYSSFSVGPQSSNYTLSVSGYQVSSTAGDSLTTDLLWPGMSNNMQFSTSDNDNHYCAVTYSGGWWYNACLNANPMGTYYPSATTTNGEGIVWYTAFNDWYTFKHMKLKIQKP